MTTSHLPRRAVLGAVLAASVVGGGVVALAADGTGGLGLPTAGCNTVADAKGDGSTGSQEGLPGSAPNDPDLDITGVVFGSTPTAITSVIRVDKLASAPTPGVGHYWVVDFSAAGKDVEFASSRLVEPLQTAYSAALLSDTVKIGGTTNKTIALTATYDTKNSLVILSADRVALEKALGAPLAGTNLTKLHIESGFHVVSGYESADVADGKADAPYTVDTNPCFGAATAPAAPAAPAPAPAPADPPPAAAPAPSGSGDPSKLPNADCFLAKDPKGDAHLQSQSNVPNDPDLDLTSMTLGSDDKNLYGYLKVDKLAAGPMIHDGHRFYVNFTFNKHNFTAAGSAYKNAQSASFKDGLAQSGQVAHVTQLAVDGVSSATDPNRVTGNGPGFVASGLKFVFDTKTSTVTAILPVADIEKYGKAPVAGATFTSVYAGAYGDSYAVASPADAMPDGATTPETSKVTWAVGDNHCFGAAAPAAAAGGPLTNAGVTKAQYGDDAAVAAKLVDASGAPAAGKDVTFTLGASTVTAATGADGIAKASLPVKDKAGKRSLVLTSGDAKTAVDFTVLVEKTVLKASGSKGAVTATLTDDDKKPVVGQVVTFTSGSKKVTAKTDAKGVAKAKGLPAGNVKVGYPGAAGMYSAASTATRA